MERARPLRAGARTLGPEARPREARGCIRVQECAFQSLPLAAREQGEALRGLGGPGPGDVRGAGKCTGLGDPGGRRPLPAPGGRVVSLPAAQRKEALQKGAGAGRRTELDSVAVLSES